MHQSYNSFLNTWILSLFFNFAGSKFQIESQSSWKIYIQICKFCFKLQQPGWILRWRGNKYIAQIARVGATETFIYLVHQKTALD